MTPSNVCRKRFAALRQAYAKAIAEGEPIKAGNIARQMAKVREAAWSIKVLEDRARTHSLTMAGLEPAIQSPKRSAGSPPRDARLGPAFLIRSAHKKSLVCPAMEGL